MMKNIVPLLISVSTLLLLTTSCGIETPGASSSSDNSSHTPKQSSAPVASDAQITADQIVPAFSRPDTAEDVPPEEIADQSIKQVSFRALAPLSYAEEFAAVNDSGELCLAAWANSGDGDGTATLSGPSIECDDPAEVKAEGLLVRIEATQDNPGVVLSMLPPDLTEEVVRVELLKIPGNHEDLRPPVEFNATDYGLVSVAMLPETADKLGNISIPRPDGATFTLNLD